MPLPSCIDARRLNSITTGNERCRASPDPGAPAWPERGACRPDSWDAPLGPARACPPGTPRSLGHGVRMRLVGSPPRGVIPELLLDRTALTEPAAARQRV